MNKSRIKGASTRIIIVSLMIVLLIAIIAYYINDMKGEPKLSRLGITPEEMPNETTTSTTVPMEMGILGCNTTEDCPEQTKCDGEMFYYRNGSCGSDNNCSYSDWNSGNCTQSVQYCGAECYNDADCGSGFNACNGDKVVHVTPYCDSKSCTCKNLTTTVENCNNYDTSQCCNNNCGVQSVDYSCSNGVCVSTIINCTNCDSYTCSEGSCTSTCSKACGAECESSNDCDIECMPDCHCVGR